MALSPLSVDLALKPSLDGEGLGEEKIKGYTIYYILINKRVL